MPNLTWTERCVSDVGLGSSYLFSFSVGFFFNPLIGGSDQACEAEVL